MALVVKTTLKVTGDDFRKIAAQQRELTPLHRRVGMLMMSQALTRLTSFVKPEQFKPGIRQSLMVGTQGRGGGDTIFAITKGSATVGSNVAHAAITQKGGVIRPKPPLKALAVPVTDQLKRAGLWPRDFAEGVLTFIPSKTGPPVLVDEEGKGGFGKGVLYVLLKSVTRPARPFLFFDAADEEEIGLMTVDFLEEAE